MKKLLITLALLVPMFCEAQSYAINWHKVAGGGGTSAGTNGSTVYSLSGTIGQHDASTAMTGGPYALTGGYWSMISLVQMTGAPLLSIAESGNSAVISWPYPSTGFVLQTNGNLSNPQGWAPYAGSITSNVNGSNNATITPPTGQLFFRLGP